MNIGFVTNNIVIPIITIFFVWFSKNKRTQANILLFKGIFYFYLAIGLIINCISDGFAEKQVVGFTLAISIIEGGYAVRDGIEKVKEYFNEERDRV